MKRIAPLILFFAALTACGGEKNDPAAALKQTLPGATVVGNEPTCLDCEVDIELLSDLAEARDKDVITGDLRSMLTTMEGVVITTVVPGPPLLFGVDGRLIKPITGSTPEDAFVNPTLMRYAWGDSIVVLDEMAKRIVVLSPSLSPARFIPVDVPVTDMLPLADGDVLLVSPRTVGDSINPFLRISGVTGAIMDPPATSFRKSPTGDAAFNSRVIALARDGAHIWSAHTLRYAIEKRRLSGEVVQLLEREVSWFPPSEAVSPVAPASQPTPRVVGIWEDVRGLLWVHTITADRRWPNAIGTLTGVDGKSRYFIESKDLYSDSRIEIIDPQTGGLVATAKFDSEYPTLTPGTFMSRVVKGPSGWLVAEVWRVIFNGWTGR
jgi:hypothetical protein